MTQWIRFLFWFAVAAILYFTLRPVTVIVPGSDKTQHAISFGMLMLLAAFAYPRARLSSLVIGLSALGAGIELIQPFFGRSDDVLDWVADTVGVLIALLLVLAVRQVADGRRVR